MNLRVRSLKPQAVYPHTNARTYKRAKTHSPTYTRILTHTLTHTHVHAQTHRTRSQLLMGTAHRPNTHTHIHRTHTHVHTQTHRIRSQLLMGTAHRPWQRRLWKGLSVMSSPSSTPHLLPRPRSGRSALTKAYYPYNFKSKPSSTPHLLPRPRSARSTLTLTNPITVCPTQVRPHTYCRGFARAGPTSSI